MQFNTDSKRVNHDFFKSIDTESKAYWFGMIAADGFLLEADTGREDREKYYKVGLVSTDLDNIENFKRALDITTKTYVRKQMLNKNKGTIRESKIYTAYDAIVSSHRMYYDLYVKGLTHRKSLTLGNIFENIDDTLKIHVLRGYFDGDGSVGIRADTKYPWFAVLGTKVVAQYFIDYFNLGSGTIRPLENNITYVARFSKRSDIVEVLEKLYTDSTVSLNRKYNYAMKIINY